MNTFFTWLTKRQLRLKRKTSEKEILFPFTMGGVCSELLIREYTFPYRHYIIDNFLKPEQAEKLSNYFDQLLTQKDKSFSYFDIYDLYSHSLIKGENSTADIFFSKEYKLLIEKLISRSLAPYTQVIMHNNVPRKDDKYIHTDYVDVVFKIANGNNNDLHPGELAKSTGQFLTSATTEIPAGYEPKKRVVTALLYLNKNWKKSDGGETGIFHKNGNKFIEVASVEPLFNRLFIFEITPNSYHNYKSSSLKNRNSISQWLYA